MSEGDEKPEESSGYDHQAHGFFGRFPALRNLGGTYKPREIPFIQQLSATECGAACLAMTLGYFGRSVRLDEVRTAMGIGRDGSTALAILETARRMGLRGRGVKVEMEELELLDPGTILHWEFNHFVVFQDLHDDAVEIVDPGFGRRKLPFDLFRKAFTGVALLLEPGPDFEKREKPTNPVWAYFRQMLSQREVLTRIMVVSALAQFLALALPSLTGAVVDRVVPRGDYHLLLILSIGLSAVTVFYFIANLVRGHLLLHLRTVLDARMTLGFLDHLVDLPYPYFQMRSAGDLIARLNSNTTIREILTGGVLSGALDGLLVTVYLALLFVASPMMGALVLVLGFLHVLTFLVTRRRQRELTAMTLQVDAKCRDFQVELFTGIETLKAMGVEHRAVQHFSNLYVDVLNVTLDRGKLSATSDAFANALRMASPLAILSFGAVLVLEGNVSLGMMLTLNALATGFLIPLAALVATASQIQLLGSYYERVQEVLETPPEKGRAEGRQVHRLRGAVSLERVSFRYTPHSPLVVKDISVQIRPGSLVAIVGGSGAGKSTLANLLLGLYLPSSGRILYDGVALDDLDLVNVRRQLGIVMQSPTLFVGSVRSNVSLAAPEATLEEIVNACKAAHIHDDIMAMPMGYETVLADRGSSLSGGQRQRLSLARALVRKPALLLLDEATSALDSVTEAKVQKSLSELKCTRVVIAHRLSTVRAADTILVMDKGTLVESGTHDELLALRHHYAALVAAQREVASRASGAGVPPGTPGAPAAPPGSAPPRPPPLGGGR